MDAESFWQMKSDLDKETKYMMYEPDERIRDIKRIENIINQSTSGDNLLLFAEDEGEIVGYISAQRGGLRRNKHTAYIVIGIRRAYQRKGIGTQFFDILNDWAKKSNIKRLELTVMCLNTGAKRLYEKYGFVIEGTKKCSMLVDGKYIDEYYMSRIL